MLKSICVGMQKVKMANMQLGDTMLCMQAVSLAASADICGRASATNIIIDRILVEAIAMILLLLVTGKIVRLSLFHFI